MLAIVLRKADVHSYEAAFAVMHRLHLRAEEFAEQFRVRNAAEIIDQTAQALERWHEFAAAAGVDDASSRSMAAQDRDLG